MVNATGRNCSGVVASALHHRCVKCGNSAQELGGVHHPLTEPESSGEAAGVGSFHQPCRCDHRRITNWCGSNGSLTKAVPLPARCTDADPVFPYRKRMLLPV